MYFLLQSKSEAQIKIYLVVISLVSLSIIFLYILNKKVRERINNYIKNHILFVITFLSFYLIYLFSRLFYPKTFFLMFFSEDGLFEYLTAIFFIAASILFLLSLSKKHTWFINSYISILGLLCFFVGMEEISWGQRIFGMQTPERLKEINYQDEITLHNLISPDLHPYIYLFVSIACLVFFAFANNNKFDFLFWIHKNYLPSKKYLVIALLLPIISWYNMEHFEVILSFLFCTYGYLLYRRNRQYSLFNK